MNNITQDRRFVIYAIFIVVAFIYLIRIFYLQIFDDIYMRSANSNVLRYTPEYPARGLIYDRFGKLMVYNDAVYDLMVITKQVKDLDTTEFCRLIGIPKEDFEKKIKKVKRTKEYSPLKPIIFEKQLSAETYAAFQEKLYKFQGFYVQPRTLRKYPDKIAAHVLGYIGEVDEKTTIKNKDYRPGDYIGISGIEQSYEKTLRGTRGVKIQMVDVFNRVKGSFRDGKYDTIAVAGENLYSSIDAELQKYGEQLMQNKVGSLVAIEPATGEILAMVCAPSYDPNLLVGRIRTANYGKLLIDPLKPLFNRALMAQYPPGSTFKPVMALVGQQEGVLNSQTRYGCDGGFHLGGLTVDCEHVHGTISMIPAISHSCNTYFCYVFRSVIDSRRYHSTEEAFESWRKSMISFGIGTRLNIDLPNALRGSLPTVPYYDKYFGKGHWKSSTIISLGIGQGELGLTPMQMANVAAIIANRGYYYNPHIIKAIGDNKTQLKEYTTRQYCNVDAAYFDDVVQGLADVVTGGTAFASRIKDIEFCGKTGTAQNPRGKPNSLFMAFAPRDNPKIAIAVVIENGGYGAAWATPIASLMIEKYINRTVARKDIEERMMAGNLIPSIKVELGMPKIIKEDTHEAPIHYKKAEPSKSDTGKKIIKPILPRKEKPDTTKH